MNKIKNIFLSIGILVITSIALMAAIGPGSAFPHNYSITNNNNDCTVSIVSITKSWSSTGGVLKSIDLGKGGTSTANSGSITYGVDKKLNPHEKLKGQFFYISTKDGVGPGSISTSIHITVTGTCTCTTDSSGTTYISE